MTANVRPRSEVLVRRVRECIFVAATRGRPKLSRLDPRTTAAIQDCLGRNLEASGKTHCDLTGKDNPLRDYRLTRQQVQRLLTTQTMSESGAHALVQNAFVEDVIDEVDLWLLLEAINKGVPPGEPLDMEPYVVFGSPSKRILNEVRIRARQLRWSKRTLQEITVAVNHGLRKTLWPARNSWFEIELKWSPQAMEEDSRFREFIANMQKCADVRSRKRVTNR